MGMIVYECANCGDGFQYEESDEWNQQMVDQEARENGWDPGGEGMAVVCDECYAILIREHTN
jgi:hypothetical protein